MSHKHADCWESDFKSTRELGIKVQFQSVKQIDKDNWGVYAKCLIYLQYAIKPLHTPHEFFLSILVQQNTCTCKSLVAT